MELVFTLANLLVLPFWLLMIALPHWRFTRRVVASPWVVVPLPVAYAVLIVPHLPQLVPLLVHPRLGQIAALLDTPEGAAMGWMHFLAFDLFVGRWAYLDSRERGVSAWLMAPVLFLTLMVGPVGLLSYLGLRAWHARGSRRLQPAGGGAG